MADKVAYECAVEAEACLVQDIGNSSNKHFELSAAAAGYQAGMWQELCSQWHDILLRYA